MEVWPAILLFVSQTVTVSLLVIQSRLNTHGYNRLAMINSLGIGVTQLALWKIMPDSGWLEIMAFLTAGPVGNAIAQYINRRDVERIRRLRDYK